MNKFIVIFTLFVSLNCFAGLTVTIEKPNLLLRQLPDVAMKTGPVLSEHEQEFAPLISQHLKAGTLTSLLTSLEKKLKKRDEISPAMGYLLGQLSLQKGDVKRASQYLKQAVELQADYGKAWYALGIAYSQLSEFSQASFALSKALQLDIKDPHIYLYMGYSFVEQQAYQSAVLAYQQAKLRLPDSTQTDKALLFAYNQSGQVDAALALLNQLIEATPSDKSLWLYRANAQIGKQRFSKAIASMETAVRLGEKTSSNLLLLAQLHMQHGSAKRAISLYELSGAHKDNPNHLFDGVRYFLAQGQNRNGAKLLAKLKLSQLPSQLAKSELAYLQAKLAHQQGSKTKASRYLSKALKHNVVNGEALVFSAQLKRQQGHDHQAQMLLLRAAKIEAVSVQALSEHADLMLALGRYQQALTYLKQALSQAPDNQQIVNNIRTLDKIISQNET